jgi:hypothetical protein
MYNDGVSILLPGATTRLISYHIKFHSYLIGLFVNSLSEVKKNSGKCTRILYNDGVGMFIIPDFCTNGKCSTYPLPCITMLSPSFYSGLVTVTVSLYVSSRSVDQWRACICVLLAIGLIDSCRRSYINACMPLTRRYLPVISSLRDCQGRQFLYL